MKAKQREAEQHAAFLRDLPALVKHEVAEGIKLDNMIKTPSFEEFERQVLDAFDR